MEFDFELKQVFPNYIVRIGSDLLPVDINTVHHSVGPNANSRGGGANFYLIQERVSAILDKMGINSAKAQQLNHVITSGSKLRSQEDHIAYVLIDQSHVLGFLKGQFTLRIIKEIKFVRNQAFER